MTLIAATGVAPDALPVFELPRESVDLVVLESISGGQPTSGLETKALPYDPDAADEARPGTSGWAPAVAAGDDVGHLVNGLAPGLHAVWVRTPSNPETPVRKVAYVRVT